MADDTNWNSIEPVRSALRKLVAKVDLELSSLQGEDQTARPEVMKRLAGAWSNLVGELALGPEPVLRECPFCKLSILREATRCRYCMKQSPAALLGAGA